MPADPTTLRALAARAEAARCLLGRCIEGEDCPHVYRCWGRGEDAKAERAALAAAAERGA